MKFLRNFNLTLVGAVFGAVILGTIVFSLLRSKNNDEVLVAAKRLEKKALPNSISGQINEEKFLLIYLASGCNACAKELALVSELNVNQPGLKIFGVMGESELVVKNYVRDNNIKFPVMLDRNLDMLRDLKLEYFPTNLTIEDGIIKHAYLGPPKDKEELLGLLPN